MAAETASERPWWRDHIALATGLLSVTFVALRILATAHFSPETAAGILVTAGTGQVVVGTLLNVAPALPALFVAVWASYNVWRVLEGKAVRRLPVQCVVLGAANLLAVFATPLTGFLIMLAISVSCVILVWRKPRRSVTVWRGAGPSGPQKIRSALYGFLTVGAPIAFVVAIATSQQVWLPTESITVMGRSAATGYVLQDSGSTTVVLWDTDRRLERFTPASVTRLFCETRKSGSFSFNEPAIAWVYRPALPSYPKCPAG